VAYGVLANTLTEQKLTVCFADVVSGLAVIAIAVLIFPVLVSSSRILTVGYLTLKLLEGILMIAGGFMFLMESMQTFRDNIYDVYHFYSFILSSFIFYYLLLKSRVVPAFIAVWGLLAAFLLLLKAILGAIGYENPVPDSLVILIVLNEVFLAVWLMIKGFRIPARERPV
jgi:hypothetical protein